VFLLIDCGSIIVGLINNGCWVFKDATETCT